MTDQYTENPRILQRIRTVSSLGILLDGYNLSIIAVALIPLTAYFHLKGGSTGLLASSMLLGSVVGGLSAGVLADRFGRRTLLISDLIVFIVFSIASAATFNYLLLVVARFIVGVAVGADYAISPTYLAEFSPKERRGYHMGFMWLAWTVGAAFSFGLGAIAVGVLPASASWRLLFAIGIIPAIVGLIMRVGLPESKRWLERRPRRRSQKTPGFGKGSGRAWALALVPWFFMDFSTYGLGLLLPLLLKSTGLTSDTGAILATGLAALAGGLGSFWAMFRLDRTGRMILQIWGFVLSAAGLGILAGLLWSGWQMFLGLIVGIMVVNLLNGVGPGMTTGIVPAEVFPTLQRATGQGAATAFSRIGAVVGVFTLGFFETHGGLAAVLGVTGLSSLLGAVSTFLFRIEPNQQPLPEIPEGLLSQDVP